MEPSTFAERLAYARLLCLWRTGEYPGNAEIGRAVGRTGQAVTKWSTFDEAPLDWRLHAPLARVLDAPEAWLIRGEGNPPRPELWVLWIAERRGVAEEPHYKRLARQYGLDVATGTDPAERLARREAQKKRAAGEGRPVPRKKKR